MSLVINVTYDGSVNSAPAGFKSVVNSVVQFFESKFSDPVTVNIRVGYGEVGGHPLNSGALGQSLYNLNSYSYSQIRSALATDATTADDVTANASLSDVSPVSGNFWVSQAEAKALGLLGNTTNLDGSIGFASGNKFDYNNSNGVTAGLYDFFGVVAHEISEVMGRFLLVGAAVGSIPKGYSLLDLFHYSSAGHRDFVGTQPGYFSINSGVTNLDNFNTTVGGDFGDWATSAGRDAFRAFSQSGVVNAVSATDLRELDILGWDLTRSTPVTVKSSASINGTTASATVGNAAKVDGGPANHHLIADAERDQFNFRSPNDTATNIGSKIDAAHVILAEPAAVPAGSHIDHRDSLASHAEDTHFSTDHVLANTRSDPEGSHAAGTEFATLFGHANLAASDFLFG